MICPECGATLVEAWQEVHWPQRPSTRIMRCTTPVCRHEEPLPVHVVLEREGHARLPGM